tara:strand:+ start:1326 stop:1592 length:267 start_codon:yes stop_codon:yes gene_type:complete
MKYDPNNPISDEELDKIAKEDFDKFLEYLDSKSAYLKTKTRPLNSHELKKMAMLDAKIKGKDVSNEEWESIKEMGKQNEEQIKKRWQK